MNQPVWLLSEIIDEIHALQIEGHGGAPGTRDRGLLESALGRPANAFSYGDGDLLDIAAACAFGLARNHPFIDGNKRTAFLCAYVFLRLYGLMLVAEEVNTTKTMIAFSAGSLGEAAFATWLRANSVRMS